MCIHIAEEFFVGIVGNRQMTVCSGGRRNQIQNLMQSDDISCHRPIRPSTEEFSVMSESDKATHFFAGVILQQALLCKKNISIYKKSHNLTSQLEFPTFTF